MVVGNGGPTTVNPEPVVNQNLRPKTCYPNPFVVPTHNCNTTMRSSRSLSSAMRSCYAVVATLLASGCATPVPPAQSPAPAAAPAAAPAPMEPGLLPLRYDASNGKVFLTIPRLGE